MKGQCLPFHQVPHTSRLFSDFLYNHPKVEKFYPSSPYFLQDLKPPAYDGARRQQITAILERQNQGWKASPKTLANISRLRAGASAVVTGQQVGLFGGPVFALFKALTAVKFADSATSAGVDAVPLFWLATEDHDLAEVNHVAIANSDFSLEEVRTGAQGQDGAPVGRIKFSDEIAAVIDQAAAILGESEIITALREAYRPGSNFGDSFAHLFAGLFADFGLILLDPSDPELHRLAVPILRESIERSAELGNDLLARGKELERANYHQQVKVTESSTLLFALENGSRTVIHRKANDEFQIGSRRLAKPQLLLEIESHPEWFSANALLRPVMQDYLLPTLAYVGGPAEIAYFAQSAIVYQSLLGHVTPVTPRFSATVLEPKIAGLLSRYTLNFQDVLHGPDAIREELAQRSLPEGVQVAFNNAEKSVHSSIEEVQQALAKLDPTLVEAAARASSKIEYQINRLRSRAAKAELRRIEVLGRHAAMISNALYPKKNLQEREVGGIYFLARYGSNFLRKMYDAVRPDCLDHQLVEI